jgi:hypothetical protein
MKHIKFISLLFASLVVSSFVLPQVTAEETEKLPETMPDNLFDKLLITFFKATVNTFGMPWFVLRFTEPDSFTANPNIIEIEYLNTAEIIIGVIDKTTGNYKSLEDYPRHPLFTGYDFEFKLELPDYLPEDAFIATFKPQRLDVYEEGEVKTKLTVLSNIPHDAVLPENIVLRVNITKYVTAGNLYLPPKGRRGFLPFSLLTGKSSTILWFLAATGITNPANPFGRLYSGKRDIEYITYVDILVKFRRSHLIDIIPPDRMELESDKAYYIPIEVRNLGSHIDSFNFRVSVSEESGLIVSPPPAITLGPNEVGYTTIGVVTSDRAWDPGSLHSIKIEAYSIYEPNRVYNNSVTVVTRGVYISEISGVYFGITIVIIFLGVGIYLYQRRRILDKICRKPEKPWEIPEEKKYLEKLKEKDKEKYNEILKIMEDEYKSALLWYEHYCRGMFEKRFLEKKKARKFKVEFLKIIKKPDKGIQGKQQKEKPVEKLEAKEQAVEEIQKPEEVVKEPERERVDREAEIEQRKREKALLKIKREQEKQRKKFKKLSY